MSFFRVILVILCGFGPSLLMGMEKESKPATFKYSNPYFDLELQKTLLLLMQKNSDHEKLALPRDVILIISEKSYGLYCDELFHSDQRLKSNYIKVESFEEFWKPSFRYVNNEKRLELFLGKKIEINDFDFVTMSDEGRSVFYNFTRAVLANLRDDMVDRMYLDLPWQERFDVRALRNDSCDKVSSVEYNAMLKLPARLRVKGGNFCTVLVAEEQKYSLCGKKEYLLQSGINASVAAFTTAFCVWLQSGDKNLCRQEDVPRFLLLGAMSGAALSAAFSAKDYKERTQDRTRMVDVTKRLAPEEFEKVRELEKQKSRKKELEKFTNKQLSGLTNDLSKSVQLDYVNLINRE